MKSQIFVRWLTGYGWLVMVGKRYGYGCTPVSGFSGDGVPLERVLAWCGSRDVTILPTAS